ncbi:MAG TPA: hypothetical protein PLU30_02510 [Verrucomicrobiae bacterium]|nr:hypothetical protein [Verrucomicrobiae bacterium]
MTPDRIILAAASIPTHPGTGDCLRYQVVGLVVVMMALAMLWVICELAGLAFRSTRVREVRSLGGSDVFDDEVEQGVVDAVIMAAVHATLGPGHRIVSAVPEPKEEPAVVAAVAAAVHAALGPGHRVASVRLVPDASRAAWSAEGRRQHFQSHKVR